MNRRGFFKAIGAAFAATTLPVRTLAALVPKCGYGFVSWKMYTRAVILNEQWFGRIDNVRFVETAELGEQ